MADYITNETEKAIIELVTDNLDSGVYIEDIGYKRIEFRVYKPTVLDNILKKMKFKDWGSIIDYPSLPQTDSIIGYDAIDNYNKMQRINTSKKYNCILIYSVNKYSTLLTFVVNSEDVKKILKVLRPIINSDENIDIFKNVDFKCKKNEYVDIVYNENVEGNEDSRIKAIKRTVEKENLVFNKSSELFNVMNDIYTFFQDETKELYKKMDIVYKRGIIIHGDPGQGKSAMIREIIRHLSDVNKIIINPSVYDITKVLSGLLNKLNKQKTVIVIEDIDSFIHVENRSEFLNLLDGVNVKSGVYFIATTNYPERIDPAFMNRSGRFDRTYKIGNPEPELREAYFKSKNIALLLSSFEVHKENSEDSNLGIIDLFVKYSNELSMANLKELMITTQYMLATGAENTIEEALIKANNILIKAKNDVANNEGVGSRYGRYPRYNRYNSRRYSEEEYE